MKKEFLEEWKAYYKKHTVGDCDFMTERDIFISRIQMYYDRYGIDRSAENDADSLLARAFEKGSNLKFLDCIKQMIMINKKEAPYEGFDKNKDVF